MKAFTQFLGTNGVCKIYRIGNWKYLKYADGRGWWKFERKFLHG